MDLRQGLSQEIKKVFVLSGNQPLGTGLVSEGHGAARLTARNSFLRQIKIVLLTLGLWFFFIPAITREQSVTPPPIQAKAALVMDAETGAMLWAKNPDLPLPPASTTKILTAYLQLEALSPDKTVKVPPEATHLAGITLPLHAGEVYTSSELLHAQLLESANDAATAAALGVEPTLPRFVERMNRTARTLGATHSHFVNPHGLDAPDHLSTAHDLAVIARAAMSRYPEFATAVKTREYDIPANDTHPAHLLKNRNDLLQRSPETVDGIKTGYTERAGYCFVGTGIRNGRRLITVVLNSPDWQGETLALLRSGDRTTPNTQRQTPDAKRVIPNIKRQTPGLPTPDPQRPTPIAQRLLWLLPVAALMALILSRYSLPRLSLDFLSKGKIPFMSHSEPTEPTTPLTQPLPTQIPVSNSLPTLPLSPLVRRETSDWMKDWLKDETRLADPALRGIARDAVAQNPDPYAEVLAPLLASPKPLTRFAAADLVASFSPGQSEEALLCLLDEETITPGLRESVADRLAEVGGDRHEAFWSSLFLREGEVFAARALVSQVWLRKGTKDDLARAFGIMPAVESRGGEVEKRHRQRAALAVTLAVHGVITEDNAQEALATLTPPNRETLLESLGAKTGDSETGTVVLSRPTPSPRVRKMLDTLRETPSELADEISEASEISAEPQATTEETIAALQIASLKMGFGLVPDEALAEIFRRAKVGEGATQLLEYPELAPLAAAYTQPAVQARVSALMTDPHTLSQTLNSLAQEADKSPVLEAELAFWEDKRRR